ncbi:MAG: paraquat-inducible protein A [Candidatus Cyclobacteriaceae bacterium M2_1C_046]
MKKFIPYSLIILLAVSLLSIASWSAFKVYKLSLESTSIKKDLSKVNSITYGILSVNIWREHVTNIILKSIDEFELTTKQNDTLTYEINQILNAIVDRADQLLDEKQTSIKGKLRKFAINTIVKEEDVRALVPVFSKSIVEEIQTPKNKDALKYLVSSKLQEYSDRTQANAGEEQLIVAILKKYESEDLNEFNQKTESRLQILEDKIYFYTFLTLSIIPLFLLLWWLVRHYKLIHTPLFIISVFLALVILAAGLTTPMIEIDARFKEVSLLLIGEEISFKNQIIFFQSKSILDVVNILIGTRKFDSVLVGILVLLFSIVLPLAKLLSTQIYLAGNTRLRKNQIINFFAFKSGKWSMADVYVIAIFMAYIGFKGILDDQLSILNIDTESLASISTNKTSLQPGFIIFIGFVLYNLILSVILKKITIKGREIGLTS